MHAYLHILGSNPFATTFRVFLSDIFAALWRKSAIAFFKLAFEKTANSSLLLSKAKVTRCNLQFVNACNSQSAIGEELDTAFIKFIKTDYHCCFISVIAKNCLLRRQEMFLVETTVWSSGILYPFCRCIIKDKLRLISRPLICKFLCLMCSQHNYFLLKLIYLTWQPRLASVFSCK